MGTSVKIASGQTFSLLSSATTATGAWVNQQSPNITIQASVVGTGAVTAEVVIEASNDGINAVSTPLGTITLSGTTSNSDGFVSTAPWKYVRARLTSISGTAAVTTVLMGI